MFFLGRLKIFRVFFLITGLLHLSCTLADETPEANLAGRHGIALDRETQRRLGLQTTELQAAHYQPEFIAYGIVQDLQPLMELRNRYFAALAAQNISAARLQQAQKSLARLDELYREDIVAQSKLQTQQAQWQADRAQAGADRYQVSAIRTSAELQWGKKLADWALSDASAPVLTPPAKLLLVTLPPERSLPEQLKTIRIERSGNRAHAAEASFVSAAPQTNGAFQGETYFFSSVDDALRTGMRVTVWIAQQQAALEGVTIPAAAVVWYLGQAFVYVQSDVERFERRAIDAGLPAAQGYFVQNQLAPGDKLVTIGAQMLLSEEFRTQIPSEDDD
jgi:hypothetical protein